MINALFIGCVFSYIDILSKGGNKLNFNIDNILYFAGIIVTVGAALGYIAKWTKPLKDALKSLEEKAEKSEVEELEKRVEQIEQYQKQQFSQLQTVETATEKICKCVLAITDHELTGNSVDKLRKAKDEMQDFLIEK